MYIIEYTLATGDVRHSQPIGDEETADRWRRLLLEDPQVVEAKLVPAVEAEDVTTTTTAITAA